MRGEGGQGGRGGQRAKKGLFGIVCLFFPYCPSPNSTPFDAIVYVFVFFFCFQTW